MIRSRWVFAAAAIASLTACSPNASPQAPAPATVTVTAEAEAKPEIPEEPETPETPSPESTEPSAPAAEPVEETFTMPDLVGMNLQLAQDTLQSLNSWFIDQEDASGLDRMQMVDSNWQVCRQDPAPGTAVPISTIVTVWNVKLDEACP